MSLSLIFCLKFHSFIIVCPSQELTKHIKTKVKPLAFTSYKTLKKKQKTKRDLELVLRTNYFLHACQRKIFLTLYSITCLTKIAWLSLLFEISVNILTVIVCVPARSTSRKKLFRWNKKTFIILKWFHWNK